jgi:hypothetical protein
LNTRDRNCGEVFRSRRVVWLEHGSEFRTASRSASGRRAFWLRSICSDSESGLRHGGIELSMSEVGPDYGTDAVTNPVPVALFVYSHHLTRNRPFAGAVGVK